MCQRALAVAACVLILAGCQQASREANTPGGVTAPSAVLMKAVEVPFSGAVVGQVEFGGGCAAGWKAIITAEGPVSHMGRSAWRSEHCVYMGQVTHGELELTAANGGVLRATYTATCTTVPVGETIVCSGPAVLLPGTGRFEDAEGTALFRGSVTNLGMSQALWPGTWELLDGSIRY
jgi:hypothetical protein